MGKRKKPLNALPLLNNAPKHDTIGERDQLNSRQVAFRHFLAHRGRNVAAWRAVGIHQKGETVSHTVEVRTQVKDLAAIRAACLRLGLLPPVEGQHRLFSETVAGVGVQLPGWTYPAVFDMTTGTVRIDNYGERWGATVELQKFQQAYAVEKARIEARRKGHTVSEQTLSDGSIKLTIQVKGGAA